MSRLENFIWFEKYRPQTFDDMSIDKNYKAKFAEYVEAGEIPHLLLAGIQGSGKTTSAYIFMKSIPCVKLVLNASGADRGIDTIRGKIKQFAASEPPAGKIKIVLLDEADAITAEAQNALKNTMETYSGSCRFILTCNHVDKVIAPIQSRCTRYTFDRFPKRKLINLCESILAKENVTEFVREDVLEVINRFYPDVRSVINNLQSACVSGSLNLKSLGSLKVDPTEVGELIKQGRIQSIRQHLAGTMSFDFMYRWLWNEFISQFTDEQQANIAYVIKDAQVAEPTIPDRELNFVVCCIGIMTALGVDYTFNK